jgi:hypothetical protein
MLGGAGQGGVASWLPWETFRGFFSKKEHDGKVPWKQIIYYPQGILMSSFQIMNVCLLTPQLTPVSTLLSLSVPFSLSLSFFLLLILEHNLKQPTTRIISLSYLNIWCKFYFLCSIISYLPSSRLEAPESYIGFFLWFTNSWVIVHRGYRLDWFNFSETDYTWAWSDLARLGAPVKTRQLRGIQ